MILLNSINLFTLTNCYWYYRFYYKSVFYLWKFGQVHLFILIGILTPIIKTWFYISTSCYLILQDLRPSINQLLIKVLIVTLLIMRGYLLSKSLLYQPLSLLLSETFKKKKSYAFYVIVIRQAVYLISNILRKNYL